MELKVSSRSEGDRVVVALSGEIDLYTAPRLQSRLASELNVDYPVRLVVNMSGVNFCDSTGMNVLLAAQRMAREHGGNVELSGPRPAVRKILQVTGLESVFTVTGDGARCLASRPRARHSREPFPRTVPAHRSRAPFPARWPRSLPAAVLPLRWAHAAER